MSSPLIVHRLQVPVSHGDNVITSPATQGTALAINSTVKLKDTNTERLLTYESAE
jgi:hypothetical protein